MFSKSDIEARINAIQDAMNQTAAHHNLLCGRKAEMDELLAKVIAKENESINKECEDAA